jgi:hypothetical protein
MHVPLLVLLRKLKYFFHAFTDMDPANPRYIQGLSSYRAVKTVRFSYNKTGDVRTNATFGRVHTTVIAVESSKYYIWVFVAVGISMQCACAILSSMASPAVHFPTLSYKRHDFRKINLLNIKCVCGVSLRLCFSPKFSSF